MSLKLPLSTLKPQRGFTLIEIMVVLIIVGLLAALVVPSVMNRPDEARHIKAAQDIRTIESALKLYRLDNYRYPTSQQGLEVLSQRPPQAQNWRGPYMENLPRDPWGQAYRYRRPGRDDRDFDVYTPGADRREGGDGADADIGTWNLER